MDEDRDSKYGKINNVQRIPNEIFNDKDKEKKRFESIFVGIEEIQYINRRKHNFRIGIHNEYKIPTSFGTIYSECGVELLYAGYLCSHKRKTNDDIYDYNDYISSNGKLQNYYLGFKVNDKSKSLITWDWNSKLINHRWCRLYPEDSRRYIYHRFVHQWILYDLDLMMILFYL